MVSKVVFKCMKRKGLSAMAPLEYSKRFEKFMMNKVFTYPDELIRDTYQNSFIYIGDRQTSFECQWYDKDIL